MERRLDYFKASPDAMKTMMNMERYLASCYRSKKNLDRKLIELVKIRVSQINGCAYCIDIHAKDAIDIGESIHQIYSLSAWREAPFYTDTERAALAWAEATTLISNNEISDELYEETTQHFDEEQLVDLTLAITTINAWNRIGISFRSQAGAYKPGDFGV